MELGVDIGSLDTVAQVGVPPTLTNYVQRSGRTGRTRGSSSLVMTVIRGQHPVDGHYYARIVISENLNPSGFLIRRTSTRYSRDTSSQRYSHTLLEIRTKTKCLS